VQRLLRRLERFGGIECLRRGRLGHLVRLVDERGREGGVGRERGSFIMNFPEPGVGCRPRTGSTSEIREMILKIQTLVCFLCKGKVKQEVTFGNFCLFGSVFQGD
jgi:hypothetical protein